MKNQQFPKDNKKNIDNSQKMAIKSDSWWLFSIKTKSGHIYIKKDNDMCHNGKKPNNRRDDATDECLRLALNKEYTEDKLLILNDFRKSKPLVKEGQGWDGYAGEIRATFRPSAAILLKAWEDLLDTIEDTDIDDNNDQDYGK